MPRAPGSAQRDYNHNSRWFDFETPGGAPLGLPVCACVLVRGFDGDGTATVRPYTPVSQAVDGRLSLLVKVYEKGVVSKWLDGLKIGDKAAFKHITFNIKVPYP